MSVGLDDFFDGEDEDVSRETSVGKKKKRKRNPWWLDLLIVLGVMAAVVAGLHFFTPLKFKDGQITGLPYKVTHPFAEEIQVQEPDNNINADKLSDPDERAKLKESGYTDQQLDDMLAAAQDDSEHKVYATGDGQMPVDERGVGYAPMPQEQFRDVDPATCTADPSKPASLPADSWSVPALNASAPYIKGYPDSLPNAPYGLLHASYADPAVDETGNIIIGGHVNYNGSGALSSFGLLHQATPCMHVYINGVDGQVKDMVITSMYTVPQNEIENDQIYVDDKSRQRLFMLTCSGRNITDDGTYYGPTLFFPYEYNLVVEAQPFVQ